MADFTTLYQGIFDSPWNPTPKSFEENIGQGRWYTSDPTTARSYAKGLTTGTGTPKLGGSVYSMDVPTKSLSQSTKFADRLGTRGYDHLGEFGKKPNVHLATKKMITEGKPSINLGQTLGANLDVLGSKGLGFLKNNALRTLAFLGSLPAQVGIMALSPTRMGNAEMPSHQRPPAAATGHQAARERGGDYHSGHESTVGGQTTDWGPMSHMIAGGGLAQHAPIRPYSLGGLAYLLYGGLV
jgi:hypothetical protein